MKPIISKLIMVCRGIEKPIYNIKISHLLYAIHKI